MNIISQPMLLLSLVFALFLSPTYASPQNRLDSVALPQAVDSVNRLCSAVRENYVYFDQKQTDWNHACEQSVKDMQALKNPQQSLSVLEALLDELYDPHISLNRHQETSPRIVPTGADMWVDLYQGRYIVTGLRPFGGATSKGIRLGDELISLNGFSPIELAKTRMHFLKESAPKKRMLWALNAALAGYRHEPRYFAIRRKGQLLKFDPGAPEPAPEKGTVSWRKLQNNIGYIRIENSLGKRETIKAFDAALEVLKTSRGLILDLRNTPGGGGTHVAEPILGRFVSQPVPYQVSVEKGGESHIHRLNPKGPWVYNKPVVVLVGRWTGSMGEGMAVGLDGSGRAHVMGSKMAGLAGGIEKFEINKRTGLSVQMPTYDLRHLDGTPRHEWGPPDLSPADFGNGPDVLLKRAIAYLDS